MFNARESANDWLDKTAQQAPEPPANASPAFDASDGQVSPVNAFNEQFAVNDVLIRNGYERRGKRYLFPASTTGIAGVLRCDDCQDGVERVYSNHGGDPLNDGYAHDAFDCYRIIECGADMRKALAWSAEVTRHNQRTHMEARAKPLGESPWEALINLSTTQRLEQMQKDLENDRYIFDGMALAGQITLFYAMPNTGKTLLFFKLLTDAIKEKRVKGSDVSYVNADDHFKGLVTKTAIAAKYGFEMISPAESGVSPTDIIEMLSALANSPEAKGKVIILDTLKKFADMMNKKAQSELYLVLRRLIAKDATVIIAGHANKYPDDNGCLIFEGTQDVMNDIDCAYAINLTSLPEGDVTISFVRQKNRGDNVYEARYGYEKREGLSYQAMLDSVRKIDGKEDSNTDAPVQADVQAKLNKYESEILFIKAVLGGGSMNQSAILKAYKNAEKLEDALACECRQTTLKAALAELDGTVWKGVRGINNAKNYRIIYNDIPCDAGAYIRGKAGG